MDDDRVTSRASDHPSKPTSGHDALDADQLSEKSRGKLPRAHLVLPKGTVEADGKFLVLKFGLHLVRGRKSNALQSFIECRQVVRRISEEAGNIGPVFPNESPHG